MRRINRLLVILATLLLAAMLASCAAQAPSNNGKDMSGPLPAASAAPEPQADSGANAGDGSTLPVVDPGDASRSGKKVIYTVDMAIEAKDPGKALEDISNKAAELGGYMAGMQYEQQGSYSDSWITVRIAPDKLKQFTAHVGTLGKVLGQSMNTQDVTDQYTDVQSRLTNAQSQEAALLEIMKKADKIDDTLKVRQELNTVQQEIEQLKGQIRLMDNQVGYSTVKITIREPAKPAVAVEDQPDPGVQFWGFAAVGQKLGRGVSDSFNWTLNAISAVLMALSYATVPLLLIAVVVVAIILIVRGAGKKKKTS